MPPHTPIRSGRPGEAVAPLDPRLDIEARQEELAQLEVPLAAQRRPAVIEPDVDAAADVDEARGRRRLEIELEHLAELRYALLVARVGHGAAPAGARQPRGRQLRARSRHLALAGAPG